MKLSVKFALISSALLVLVLSAALALLFEQANSVVIGSISAKVEVLVKLFEDRVPDARGKEESAGANPVLQAGVDEYQKVFPTLLEINVYSVTLGKVVASTDPESIGKEVDPEDTEAAKEDKSVTLFAREDGKDVIDLTEPLHAGTIDYVIGIKSDITADRTGLNTLLLTAIALAAAGSLLGAFVTAWLVRRSLRPLRATGDLLRAMAAGDLTGRATVRGRDEIAAMATDYNLFTDHLESEMRRLQTVSQASHTLGTRLTTEADRLEDLVVSIRRVMTELQTALGRLNEGVNSPDFSLGDVQEFLRGLLADLGDQSSSVDRSRETTRQMIEALKMISDETSQRLALSTTLVDLGRRGDQQMTASVRGIREVARLTDGIAQYIGVIHDVADRTNILAMNASIEAAHAGSAGRGFAVVADEIRKLSETTATNAKNISDSLTDMVGAVGTTESDVSGTGKTIHELTTGVEHLAIAMTTVNAALMALSDETVSVTGALDHLRDLTDGVLSRSDALGSRLNPLERTMADLVGVANQNAEGFRAIARQLDELEEGSRVLTALSKENSGAGVSLEAVTRAFKTREA